MNKLALLTFTILFIFSSCTKNTTEQEVGFRMAANGAEIESDAFAAYCQTDDGEFIIIANKIINLTLPTQIQNFEEGDYVYYKSITDDTSWSYGGQTFGEDATGLPGLFTLYSEAELRINENDGETISGGAFGTLYAFDSFPIDGAEPNLIEIPYAMTFVADIVQESDFCNQQNF